MMFEILSCEICDNKDLFSILDLGSHPMCDDLVPLGDNRICKEYPIEILFCKKCITTHQRFQIYKKELFPKNYHYRSRHTADVLNGMREIAEFCEINFGDLADKKVLDIGCNDGSLLSFFRDKNAKTFGIEPTDAFREACKSGHEVINDFLDEKTAINFVKEYGQPDLITFTNVFAHIENLKNVIKALKILISNTTAIIIENHYLGSIIEKFQFDTFYHEHPRTYSCTSFAYIAELLDLNMSDVMFPSRYNGNIRVVYLPKKSKLYNHKLLAFYKQEKLFFQKLKKMAKKIAPWCENKRGSIEHLVKDYGKLPAKAFPGRAAILIKMLGLNSDLIRATYEKPQSNKINYYIPGTKIPILSDEEFDFVKNKVPLVNFAWHIPNEIKSYVQERGYYGPIVDIISSQGLV
ncbi:MAG: class I SAM-dependent methyltransferase [Candidatus Aquirickettsiella sp.]